MILWRWKLTDDMRFRMAVMNEWSISVLWWVDQGEFSEWLLLNISETLTWWIGSINPRCGWCEETMVMWPVNETTQPDMDAERKCHVQERLATNKISSSFLPNFSPVIADQYLFIFVKLEEDNICLFYNPPFGRTYRFVFSEFSDSETRSCLPRTSLSLLYF